MPPRPRRKRRRVGAAAAGWPERPLERGASLIGVLLSAIAEGFGADHLADQGGELQAAGAGALDETPDERLVVLVERVATGRVAIDHRRDARVDRARLDHQLAELGGAGELA